MYTTRRTSRPFRARIHNAYEVYWSHMQNVALYRKYRPASFDDVVGQEMIVHALKQAIEKKQVAHAYLFSGGRGIGKTTLARIVARAVGTDDRDLIEIDAASQRGIDEIRQLREEVHVLPFASPYKVYVIDEVHRLTKEAFNAFLKTLEEPPQHVIFILATTDLHKVPDTIQSRCQMFTLRAPTTAVVRDTVIRIAEQEGRTLDGAGAEIIALLADGAFRDALGILQQVLSATEAKRVTVEDVERCTGAPQSTLLIELVDALAVRNADRALRALRTMVETGNDMHHVTALLLRIVRSIIIVRYAAGEAKRIEAESAAVEWAAIDRHARDSRATIHSKLLLALIDATQRTGSTFITELPLELAIIDHCSVS